MKIINWKILILVVIILAFIIWYLDLDHEIIYNVSYAEEEVKYRNRWQEYNRFPYSDWELRYSTKCNPWGNYYLAMDLALLALVFIFLADFPPSYR